VDLDFTHGAAYFILGEALEGNLFGHVEVEGLVIVNEVDFSWVSDVIPKLPLPMNSFSLYF
jgi:hypothetical protein